MYRILLVEDDPEITGLLDLHLNSDLYKLETAVNGRDAIERVCSEAFDLIILDIMLPDLNGMEVCKQLRSRQIDIPILVLTCRGEESDKVLALELGADDYMTKPFGILELKARTKAILRRTNHQLSTTNEAAEIIFKDIQINKNKRKAMVRRQRLDLTPKEFDLLFLLVSNPGKTFSRQELLDIIWGYSFSGYEHTITAHINRLRIKIESDLNNPQYILTSWGVGYRFAE